jgi:hypothetical protein
MNMTANGFGSGNFGQNVHQNNLEPYLPREYPNTQFEMNVDTGQTVPDAVFKPALGSIHPGFDAVELKPNTPHGINTFLNSQLPNWSEYGDILMLLYDEFGNIFNPGFGTFP